jgi:WD40 repeat protein
MCTEIKGSFANPETFPNDLYYYCFFKNLNLKDLAIASRVCKHWNRMANLEVLWQELVKQDCPAFAKNETITWKALYRLNIDGAKPRKISYHGKGVICAWGKTVAIWTRTFPRGGYKRTCFETDHTGSINCFFVRGNSHETQFVTGSTDKTLKVWKKNAKDERLQLLQTLEGHNASVTALTKSSYELYSGSSDGEIRVWSPD